MEQHVKDATTWVIKETTLKDKIKKNSTQARKVVKRKFEQWEWEDIVVQNVAKIVRSTIRF